ncbi:DUF1684 domain-containing protein [Klenkia taihuensis]|uniref:DUF1684 domain-containing protein n=1 Tax=Klenkia taihuensis TaxID=1225127 RepID=A0A1I1N599_9ACTN|nr:DUF1684 domain-containing protein [Klenkia taihuensis]GHE12218.1 hypothetical protein GCM10011381_29130 [Klenkia taihuensis]SFC92789.1 hypothetical protein SAMN05661030_1975 [Klenkia taihuensis]
MTLSLLDWRRRVHALYADARAAEDPEAGWAAWRAGRDELFAGHPDSPLGEAARAAFTGLPVAPYDPQLRFRARLEDAPAQRLELPTADDGVVALDRIGRVTLGEVGRLDVWWLGGYGGGVFLPLRDGSAGRGTYGGGRYLLDTVKGADLGSADGRLVVDLNFAYHPSCTYDPRWSCPLPQEGNRVDAVVAAGEQLPEGGWY